MSKLRIIKDFDKLPKEVQAAVRAEYPNGFTHKLISYPGPKGVKIQALPFDMEDASYLVRMSILEARAPSAKDDDDDDIAILGGKDLDLHALDADEAGDDGGDDDYDDYGKKNRNDDGDSDDDY